MKATFIEGWKFFNNKIISSSIPFIFQSEFLFYIVVKKYIFLRMMKVKKICFYMMKILYSAWRKEFNHEKLYPRALPWTNLLCVKKKREKSWCLKGEKKILFMGCIEKHVGWRKKATICVWSVNDVGNFVEKVLHHPEHPHSMYVCVWIK